MTKWTMVADLRRCIGCQTCTAACRQANDTPPGERWREVLDVEIGTYPSVQRVYVPVGCQQCADAPCVDVCPTKASFYRSDGIVAIDRDLCIGCGYCAVACPYQARFITHSKDEARHGVATKCDFCSSRLDKAPALGLVPGVDPEVTPACVNSCIAGALIFGDAEAPDSKVAELAKKGFRLHEELGTETAFYYVSEEDPED